MSFVIENIVARYKTPQESEVGLLIERISDVTGETRTSFSIINMKYKPHPAIENNHMDLPTALYWSSFIKTGHLIYPEGTRATNPYYDKIVAVAKESRGRWESVYKFAR